MKSDDINHFLEVFFLPICCQTCFFQASVWVLALISDTEARSSVLIPLSVYCIASVVEIYWTREKSKVIIEGMHVRTSHFDGFVKWHMQHLREQWFPAVWNLFACWTHQCMASCMYLLKWCLQLLVVFIFIPKDIWELLSTCFKFLNFETALGNESLQPDPIDRS